MKPPPKPGRSYNRSSEGKRGWVHGVGSAVYGDRDHVACVYVLRIPDRALDGQVAGDRIPDHGFPDPWHRRRVHTVDSRVDPGHGKEGFLSAGLHLQTEWGRR